jgi:hypothetical protein
MNMDQSRRRQSTPQQTRSKTTRTLKEKDDQEKAKSRDAACQAGGLGSIPGPGQTYV